MFPYMSIPHSPMAPWIHPRDMEDGLVTVPYRTYNRLKQDVETQRRKTEEDRTATLKLRRRIEEEMREIRQEAKCYQYLATTFGYHLFAILLQRELDDRNIKLRVEMVDHRGTSHKNQAFKLKVGETVKHSFVLSHIGEADYDYQQWVVRNSEKPHEDIASTQMLKNNDTKNAVVWRLEELAGSIIVHYKYITPVKEQE